MKLSEAETRKFKEGRITLKTAKLLKDAGFSDGINGFYVEFLKTHKSDNPSFATKKGEIEYEGVYMSNNAVGDLSNENYTCYSCPFQFQVQKWLREEHGLQVYAESSTVDGNHKYKDWVAHINRRSINDPRDEEYQTYEEALEFGLQTAINSILKNE